MLNNIPIQNKARDKAWEAFIKSKQVSDLFPQEFRFPIDSGYYELWCQAWAKAWDDGFKAGWEEGMKDA